jgi:hypothetical protein
VTAVTQARVIAPVLCFLTARGGRHPGSRRAFLLPRH